VAVAAVAVLLATLLRPYIAPFRSAVFVLVSVLTFLASFVVAVGFQLKASGSEDSQQEENADTAIRAGESFAFAAVIVTVAASVLSAVRFVIDTVNTTRKKKDKLSVEDDPAEAARDGSAEEAEKKRDGSDVAMFYDVDGEGPQQPLLSAAAAAAVKPLPPPRSPPPARAAVDTSELDALLADDDANSINTPHHLQQQQHAVVAVAALPTADVTNHTWHRCDIDELLDDIPVAARHPLQQPVRTDAATMAATTMKKSLIDELLDDDEDNTRHLVDDDHDARRRRYDLL
jgi:hypothetical protein